MMYGLSIDPEYVKAIESIINLKQLRKVHYDEEEKVSSNDSLNKVKSGFSSTSNAYVILQIRPSVFNMYIAPFYFIKFIQIVDEYLGFKLPESGYHCVNGKIEAMKISK